MNTSQIKKASFNLIMTVVVMLLLVGALGMKKSTEKQSSFKKNDGTIPDSITIIVDKDTLKFKSIYQVK